MTRKQPAGSGQHLSAVLGLDVGGINTRATLFGISAGDYEAMASTAVLTSKAHGLHIGTGAAKALEALQAETEHFFLDESDGLLMPVDRIGRGVDRVALVVSAGTRVRSGLLGLSAAGSLKAGRILCDSLPLHSVIDMNMTDLRDETRCVEVLIKNRPEILVITGGEDYGETAAIERWIEITRTLCSLLPQPSRPRIVYAGNPAIELLVRRRLEPVAKLGFIPNIQPLYGQYDLLPAQNLLEQEILEAWKGELPGLGALCDLTTNLNGITVRSLERMVRFLSRSTSRSVEFTQANHAPGEEREQTTQLDPAKSTKTGVLAVDLGGMNTSIAAGIEGYFGGVVQDKFHDLSDPAISETSQAIHQLAGVGVTREETDQFLYNLALLPALVPETQEEIGLSQAFASYRLRKALEKFAGNYDWFDYQPSRGLFGCYEQIILSGAELTNAPTPEGLLLALLDGIQPWGITTFVVDRSHLLPLLGKIGEAESTLPVHILTSAAFMKLGTAVSAVGDLRKGKTALTVQVETGSGEVYTAEINQGVLKRLDIPAGESAVLELLPNPKVDIGFGGRGQGGRLSLTGGLMGVIIDARGRPLGHVADQTVRVEEKQAWLQALDMSSG